MPTNIRWMLSVVVALVAVAASYFEHRDGEDFLKLFVLFLGGLMIVAVWLFPETKRRGSRQG